MAVSHVKSNTVADWTGTVTVANSAGQYATIAATDLVRPVDWNSVHNQFYTLTGNTTNASTASGSNVLWAASGPAISLAGSTGTIIISSPPHMSFFKNFVEGGYNTTSVSGVTSHVVAFNLPEPGSFSFLRIPAVITNNSTSFGTTAATLSASVNLSSTWNAAVYSWGTGANSKSLQLVASGSMLNVANAAINVLVNGTQYSQTQALTFGIEGVTLGTSITTARSTSTINWSSTWADYTGARFIDIPFATSLSAGAYELVFGMSTSSSANSTGISGASTIFPRYSNHFCITQINSGFGGMAGTAQNLTLGGGVFSTAGGGTTNSIPHPSISTTVSQPIFPFMMARSA
jgi:hypothetical protein